MLPAGGGGCVNNEGPGPNSAFYYDTCPNAYAFPDNDGSSMYSLLDLYGGVIMIVQMVIPRLIMSFTLAATLR